MRRISRACSSRRYQPTYEELKHRGRGGQTVTVASSQPTYEELKRDTPAAPGLDKRRSQPTYEELKPDADLDLKLVAPEFPAYL